MNWEIVRRQVPRAVLGVGQVFLACALVLAIVEKARLRGLDWAAPEVLILLVPIAMLPWQSAITGANQLVVPRAVRRRISARWLLSWVPGVLQMAGLALVVLACARPQVAHRDLIVKSDGLDILLAIDTSGSMREEDLATGSRVASRLEVAKGVMAEFIRGRPYDRIGVVVFGEEAFTHVPLTLDHQTLVEVLDNVEIGIAGSRGTAIGTAIGVSARRIKQVAAPERVIVLITDGQNNAGRLSPIEAAEAARALGIRVYTIGVGKPVSVMGLQLGDGVDEETLRRVAETTGGKYFRATELRSLRAVFEIIDELEVSPAEVTEIVEHEEHFRGLLVPGLSLLLAQVVLAATWLRRGP